MSSCPAGRISEWNWALTLTNSRMSLIIKKLYSPFPEAEFFLFKSKLRGCVLSEFSDTRKEIESIYVTFQHCINLISQKCPLRHISQRVMSLVCSPGNTALWKCFNGVMMAPSTSDIKDALTLLLLFLNLQRKPPVSVCLEHFQKPFSLTFSTVVLLRPSPTAHTAF